MSHPEGYMWHKIRQFTSPVYEEDVPNLVQHLEWSTNILYAVVALLIVPAFTFSLWLMDVPTDFLFPWMACLWCFAASSFVIKDMRVVIVMQALATAAWTVCFVGMSLFSQIEGLMALAFCMPLATAIITPLRPTFFVIQGVILFAARGLAEVTWLGYDLNGLWWIGSASFSVTALSCFGVQVVRQFLQRLHQTRNQLIASDRLSTLGQHTAGIAHELKTPIASTMSEAHHLVMLMDELRQSIGHPEVELADLYEIQSEVASHLERLNGGLERIAGFVQSMHHHTQQMHHRSPPLRSANGSRPCSI